MKKGFIEKSLDQITEQNYTIYAHSVVQGRAIPDVRDGLKPVQRRVLFSMYSDLNLMPEGKFKKSAAVVGATLGKYHPHGDVALYEALVRLAQPFVMNYVLADGYGNFGSVDGDSAAAQRYTEIKLTKPAIELLSELDFDSVPMKDNFDASIKEPVVLPARFPNILINGTTGIAVGIATNIPPHNLREVCAALIHLIDNRESTSDDVLKYIKGPDFPTGGIITSSKEEILNYFNTGSGAITMRGTYIIEELEKGRKNLVFTSIPYTINKSNLVEEIAKVLSNDAVPQVLDMRDESSKDIRIVLELKKDANPEIIANFLFNKTNLQSKFHVNLTCLIPGKVDYLKMTPKKCSIVDILNEFLDFRILCITNKLKFELEKINNKIHLLEGFAILALNHKDIIEKVTKAKSKSEAYETLKTFLNLTDIQTENILETKIYKLNKEDILKQIEELESLKSKRKEIQSTLSSGEKINEIIKSDLLSIAESYGITRRTKINSKIQDVEVDANQFISDEDCYVFATNLGYVKRQKGEVAAKLKEGDNFIFGMKTSTKSPVMFLTNQGRVYTVLANGIIQTSGYGDHISTMFNMGNGESISNIFTGKNLQDHWIKILTKKGNILKIDISQFIEESTKRGRKAINLDDDDFVICSVLENSSQENLVIISTRSGRITKFTSKDIPVKDSAGKGMRAINLANDDFIILSTFANEKKQPIFEIKPIKGKILTYDMLKHGLNHRGSKGIQITKEKIENVTIKQ